MIVQDLFLILRYTILTSLLSNLGAGQDAGLCETWRKSIDADVTGRQLNRT
jgi:hypothetical protein